MLQYKILAMALNSRELEVGYIRKPKIACYK